MKHLHSTHRTQHISEDSSCLAREAKRLSTSFGTAFSHDLFSFSFLQSRAFQMHQVQTIFSDSDNRVRLVLLFSWSNVLYSTVFEGGTWRCLSIGMPLTLWIYCVKSKRWMLDYPEGNSSGIQFFKTNQLAWWKITKHYFTTFATSSFKLSTFKKLKFLMSEIISWFPDLFIFWDVAIICFWFQCII